MTRDNSPAQIETIVKITYRLTDAAWRFEKERAADIDAHWQQRVADNPHLFNGRVLLMPESKIKTTNSAQSLEGTCLTADYKSFIAWRDFGFPDANVANVFAMAALRSADGAFLLGEMSQTTASAGKIYFPAGTPDPNDLKDGLLDLEGSVLRELQEETGLRADDVRLDPDWCVVFRGPYIACMKAIHSDLTAAQLIARTEAFLAQEKVPELARLKPVFSPADIARDQTPDFVQAYLHHMWRDAGPPAGLQT